MRAAAPALRAQGCDGPGAWPQWTGAGDEIMAKDAQDAEHEQPQGDEESQSQQCQCELGQ